MEVREHLKPFAFLAVLSLMVSGLTIACVADDSDAATITQSWGKEDHDSRTIYATAGDWIDLNFNGGNISSRQYTQFQVSNRPYWMNTSNDGTAVAGDYTINVRWTKENDNGSTLSSANFTVRIIVSNPSYTHSVSYSSNGGSGSMANTSVTDTNGGNSNVTLATCTFTKAGYSFAGWKVGDTIYQPGQNVGVGANATVNAVAQWTPVPVTITSSDAGADIVAGDSFSREITTDPAGATVSFSGPSWMTLSGSTLVGTPSVAGDYTVTVNVTNGVTSASQTFTVHVVNRLAFESVPTGGILATPVI